MRKNTFLGKFSYKNLSNHIFLKKIITFSLSIFILTTSIGITPVSTFAQNMANETRSATEFNVGVNNPIVNEKTNIFVSALDNNGRVDNNFVGKVKIRSLNSEDASILPETTIDFTPSDRGVKKVIENIIFTSTGIHMIHMQSENNVIRTVKGIEIRDTPVWKNSHFEISIPNNIKTHQNIPITVRARDAHNNIIDKYKNTIMVTINSKNGNNGDIVSSNRYFPMNGGEVIINGFSVLNPGEYTIFVSNGNDGIIFPDEFGIQKGQPFIDTQSAKITVDIKDDTPKYTLTSTPTTVSNTKNNQNSSAGFSSQQKEAESVNASIWALVHCQIAKEGFTWHKPVSDYVNNSVCGQFNIRVKKPFGGIFEPIFTNNLPEKFEVADFIAFIKHIKDSAKYRDDNNNLDARTQFIKKQEDFLLKYPNFPEVYKDYFITSAAELGITYGELKEVVEKEKLVELRKLIDKNKDLEEGKIALIQTTFLPNHTINIVKNKPAQLFDNISQGIFAVDKYGKRMNGKDFKVELKNAPEGVRVLDVLANDEILQWSISEKTLLKNANTLPESFDMVVKNKKTGDTFIQTFKIKLLDEENTSNLYQMTPAQIFKSSLYLSL